MDQDSTQGRYTAQIIAKLEGVVANALLQERRRWAESHQALQHKLENLRSENVRLNIQVQSHQLESTNRALWLKRKAESDALDSRPTKLSRYQDPLSQGFAPPTPDSSRALSADVDDEVEGLQAVPASTAPPAVLVSQGDATRPNYPQRPGRPISRLPSRAQSTREGSASLPSEQDNERERVVYCLCGGHEYGLMIHCDNPKCELVWFHAGCVNLEEVPNEQEEWFCPACAGSRAERSTAPSSDAAVQATITRVDAGCQTDPESATRILLPPDTRPSFLTLPPPEITKEQQRPRLLSPFVPQLDPAPERSITPIELGQFSPGSTLTPLSTVDSRMQSTLDLETSLIGSLQEKDVVLIHVSKEVMGSSRKSLFRRLQPTARKPWADDSDTL